MDIFLKVISGIAIALASALITVQLSKQKFRSERWWEKKVDAYEKVIEAFHNAKKFSSEHMSAQDRRLDINDERRSELDASAKEARDEILKASDVGSFVLSEDALSILAQYEAESENMPMQNTWYEHLEMSWSITNKYMKVFTEEAHRDIKK